MQITIDTTTDERNRVIAVVRFLGEIFNLNTSSIDGVITHADRPDTGAMTIEELSRQLQERNSQSAQLQAVQPSAPPAAAVFGGAEIPPAAPPAAAAFGGAVAPLPPVPPSSNGAATPTASPAPTQPIAPGPAAPEPPSSGIKTVDVDATGLPWDIRIHGANRSKNKDGSWRAKRGINDEALVKRIEAELRALMALPAGSTAPPAPPAPPVPPATVPLPPGMTGAAPSPVPGTAVSFGADAGPPPDFPQLMVRLTPAMTGGRLSVPLLLEACASVGVTSLQLLAARPDLIPAVYEFIKSRTTL